MQEIGVVAGLGVMVPIVAIVGAFTFLTISAWSDSRRKERVAFYKAETMRRITETSGEGAKAAIDMLREEERTRALKAREGVKVGGLINVGVGIALVIFLGALVGLKIALCGLIPGLIGVAMLVYVYALARPLNEGPEQ